MRNPFAFAGHPDKVKKWLSCLGCGSRMWTDRCHRICKKCRRRQGASPGKRSYQVCLPREMYPPDLSTYTTVIEY